MVRSRRTLLSVFVFLSFNDGFVLCQIRPGTLPTSPENYQNVKIHIQPGSLKPDLLSAAQRLLTRAQRPTLNDFSTQPFITKPPVVTIEPSYQQLPVNVNPTPNLSIPFTPTTCNIDSSIVSSPETVIVETVVPTSSITVSSVTPSTLDYPNAVDQNYVPLNPMSFGQISQTLSMPESLYVDNFVQQPALTQFYQPPGTVQATPNLLLAAQRLLTGAQRPILNDFSTQSFTTKPPVVITEPSYQQLPVNVNPTPNLSIPFTPTTCNIDSSIVSSPETVTVETVVPTSSITVSSVTPSTLDYPNAVDQNYVPLIPMPFGQISQTLSMPESLYVDNFVQQPALTQFYQPPGTVQATPNLLLAAQRLLTGAQRPTLNDFSLQFFTTKPPVVITEPSYQQLPVNVNPTPNLSIPFTPTTCNIDSSLVSSSETVTVETVEPTSSITMSSVAPSTPDYPNAVDQNYIPLNPMSLGQISQTLSMPENLYVVNFVQQPELTQFYQPPVTVQATPIPMVTPFTSYTNSVSSDFPQNVFMGTRDLVPVLYQDTTNSQQTPVYSETGTAPISYGSNVVDSGSGYTVPLSLQINMPPQTSEQPIILLSPPAHAPVPQDSSYMSPLPPMVPPLIVMDSSRSKWRKILPLLLIALRDGGCCKNSCSSGCSGSCNIPIPYPIPIPTNNPIILSRENKKRKETSHSDED